MNVSTIQLVTGAAIVALVAWFIMLNLQKKELLGKGEAEKRFVCPKCGKKSQVGTYSSETYEFICPDCADKEKNENGGY